MGILAGKDSKHAQRGGDRVAASLHGEFDDIFRIEVIGVDGKRRARGMFDPLIDGQDRDIACSRQSAVPEQSCQAAEDALVPIAVRPDAVDEIAARQRESVPIDGLAGMSEEALGLFTQ